MEWGNGRRLPFVRVPAALSSALSRTVSSSTPFRTHVRAYNGVKELSVSPATFPSSLLAADSTSARRSHAPKAGRMHTNRCSRSPLFTLQRHGATPPWGLAVDMNKEPTQKLAPFFSKSRVDSCVCESNVWALLSVIRSPLGRASEKLSDERQPNLAFMCQLTDLFVCSCV